MKKARIKAVALNEDLPWEKASQALHSPQVHLVFASPEYLLHNPQLKKFYVKENFRTRIFGVLVDEAHVISEWGTGFRKDYGELKTLQIIVGDGVPWWALSATFTDDIFKEVYKKLGFGTRRPFWGIDVGVDRPNLAQHVYPMNSAASSYHSLIQFVPEGVETPSAIPKTIIFFHQVQATRDACIAIQALLPHHLHTCVRPFAALDDEDTKIKRLNDLRDGRVRILCCTVAAGMGCDIPDVKVAVIYGVDSFVSFVQKGGRAGRDGKIEARMVWLVEDWMFDKGGGKQMEERRAKVDEMTREYIHRQKAGDCLRKFTNRAFCPHPRSLGLPGFDGKSTDGLARMWVVRREVVEPEAGKCCSASSCCLPGSELNTGNRSRKTPIGPRSRLILNVLQHETSTAEEILGPPPGRRGVRCPKDEKARFREVLSQWRTRHWESIRATAPMLSKDWVLGEHNLKKLIDNTRLIVNTSVDKIDRRWVRALLDMTADDATVDELLSVIQNFHSGFFARRQKTKPRKPPHKRQKVPDPSPPLYSPSPTMSQCSQESHPGDQGHPRFQTSSPCGVTSLDKETQLETQRIASDVSNSLV